MDPVRKALAAVFVLVLTGSAFATPIAADGHIPSDPGPHLEDAPVEVWPPETAELVVNATEDEYFHLELESAGGSFYLDVTVTPEDELTAIRLDTGNISADEPGAYLSTDGGTLRVNDYRNEIDREVLPGGMYDLQLTGETSRFHSTVMVRPTLRFVEPGPSLNHSKLEEDPTRTFRGDTDFEPGTRLEIRARPTGEIGDEDTSDDRAFELVNETRVNEDGTFDATLNLDPVPEDTRVEVAASHDNVTRATMPLFVRTPLPKPAEGNQVSEGITFVYQGESLELESAPEQSVTGEADLDGGQPVTVHLRGTGEYAFFTSETVTVDEHGTFEAKFDLDFVPPGAEFHASASVDTDEEISGDAPGEIVTPEATENHGPLRNDRIQLDNTDQGTGNGGDRNVVAGIGALAFGTVLSFGGIGLLLGVGRAWRRRR